MARLHLISHTHWDREWYRPFQEFRLNLVGLVDGLFDLLKEDPDYLHFMLDGQTVVLEDTLQLRPDLEAELRGHIQSGRILTGPWHILPDEFLVSPEATIRNLMLGARTAARFGPRMPVGYIPDTFGHIAQMPQILQGFGLGDACIWRGVDPALPNEFWWEAPDGSRVLTAFLRYGYANAAFLYWPDPDLAVEQIKVLTAGLQPASASADILLMHGNDHMLPPRDTAQNLTAINMRLDGVQLIHSTLPDYLRAVHTHLSAKNIELPIIQGEQRCSKGAHLLPGVLSARMWIKQRNHACETLLEQWAEPFSTLARVIRGEVPQPQEKCSDSMAAAALDQAWRLLMECHPHDSICGCSVDQVHAEMVSRFDQAEQIGENLTRTSLRSIANQIDTQSEAPTGALGAVTVYNPSGFERTDIANGRIELHLADPSNLYLVDEAGRKITVEVTDVQPGQHTIWEMDRVGLLLNLGRFQKNGFDNLFIQGATFERDDKSVTIRLRVSTQPEPDLAVLSTGFEQAVSLLQDPAIEQFRVIIENPSVISLRFIADQVPGIGYQTYWLMRENTPTASQDHTSGTDLAIENEFFRVTPDPEGTVTLTDKQTGIIYPGLNQFVDGGEVGDEYNFCPPQEDQLLSPEQSDWRLEKGPAGDTLVARLQIMIPEGLASGRKGRAKHRIPMQVETRLTLSRGIPRLDIHTHVNNPAGDHRLRVHFPAPIIANSASYDSHFAVLERPLNMPAHDNTWAEAPRPEQPQRAFSCLSDGKLGLTVANRGLPEIEVRPAVDQTGSEICLTLLRCVGWLSRDDLSTRRGHAGPAIATPAAQMLGIWDFDYSVIPHTGDWENALQSAVAFNAPLRINLTPLHPGLLATRNTLVAVNPPAFLVSALKTAQDGTGAWLLRGYNPTRLPVDVVIRPMLHAKKAVFARLDETAQDDTGADPEGAFRFLAGPARIVTLKFIK